MSLGEQEVGQWIEDLGYSIQRSNRSILPNNNEIDIYIAELNLGIEYNGIYWHSTAVRSDPLFHSNKTSNALEKGVYIYHIWEDDWKNNPDKIKQNLKLITLILKKEKELYENLKSDIFDVRNIKYSFVENNTNENNSYALNMPNYPSVEIKYSEKHNFISQIIINEDLDPINCLKLWKRIVSIVDFELGIQKFSLDYSILEHILIRFNIFDKNSIDTLNPVKWSVEPINQKRCDFDSKMPYSIYGVQNRIHQIIN